jgi:hypothetical protein
MPAGTETPEGREAIRRYVVHHVTLVMDNDQRMYNRLTDAAAMAITGEMGSPAPTREDYERMLRTGNRRDEYVTAVGQAVAGELAGNLMDLDQADLWTMVLIGLLDLNDPVQADMLGEYYLPELADDIDWDEEGEE